MMQLSKATLDAAQRRSAVAPTPTPAMAQHGQPEAMPVSEVEYDRYPSRPWPWVGVVAGIVAAGYWALQLL